MRKRFLFTALVITLLANAAGAATNFVETPASSVKQSTETKSFAKVKMPMVNVRDKGSVDGKVIGVLKQGDKVEILPSDSNSKKWIKVRFKEKTGLVRLWALEFKSVAKKLAPSSNSGKVSKAKKENLSDKNLHTTPPAVTHEYFFGFGYDRERCCSG